MYRGPTFFASRVQSLAAGYSQKGHAWITQAKNASNNTASLTEKVAELVTGARSNGRQRSAGEPDTLIISRSPNSDLNDVAFSKFVFEAGEVQTYMQQYNLTVKEFLRSMVQPASQLARPPISDFNVGAVGMAASGRVYVGVNVEFAFLPLSNSIHAEQFLVANLKHHREEELVMVAVNAAPCGHCRQFFSELACADRVQFVFGNGPVDQFSLDDLLPHRFRPEDLLGEKPPPLLLQPQNNALVFTPEAKRIMDDRKKDSLFHKAVAVAFAEAQQAYAPYSRCPAGVALVTEAGDIYSGGYIESAAYNPSLPPLQTAIVDAVIDHIPCFTSVQEVILVERVNAPVRHELGMLCALPQVASEASMTILPVDWA